MPEPVAPPETFDFGDNLGYEHLVGGPGCEAGWCDSESYPRPCANPDCHGGLVHANFGDENYDGDYWLYTKCDRCGQGEA